MNSIRTLPTLPSSRDISRVIGQEMVYSKRNLKDDPAYDEESPPDKWFTPSSADVADVADGIDEELPKFLRLFRSYLITEYTVWGKPVTALMYSSYLFIACLIVAEMSNLTPNYHASFIAGIVSYAVWLLTAVAHYPYALLGERQITAWTGLYLTIIEQILFFGTLISFIFARLNNDEEVDRQKNDTYGLDEYLLIFLGLYVFFDQKFIDPAYEKLYLCYQGAITKDELEFGQARPIVGVSNEALKKVVQNSCTVLGISDEASKTIQGCLDGQRIRKNKEEAFDDWTLCISKITGAVSFAPFCVSDSKITSKQCQKLVVQMMLFFRDYMDTGKIEVGEDLRRTAPLSFSESVWKAMKLSMQLPLSFFLTILPQTFYGVVQASLVVSLFGAIFAMFITLSCIFTAHSRHQKPTFTGKFIGSAADGLKDSAIQSFIVLMVLMFLAPWINLLSSYAEVRFTTNMIDQCRRKMIRSTLKGGAKFDEVYCPGKLQDTFSSQMVQLELYIGAFFSIFPQLATIIAAVITCAHQFPFAVILFVSIVPILLSVGHFEGKAVWASFKKGKVDAKFMGKMSSAIECRKAIRASNAIEWINNDMEEVVELTRKAHFSTFFRSQIVQNFVEIVGGSVFMVLVLVPLGVQVINQMRSIESFITISGSAVALVYPISYLGQVQKMTTWYSGAIQSITLLMDDQLDEEQPSFKSSSTMTVLKKLSSSLSIKGIKFRYAATLPDVIKGVSIGLGAGTYSVLCGESGAGKSTVLSLLMRFQKPSEGTVEWDGTDIHNTTLDSFREHVSVMFQQTMIYQATIRDNILFGQPEVPGAVEKAAQDAEIAEVIERLPDGYDTVIGGDALAGMSGGQLQRVCMARALYKKPSVLLLDEATSALDAETEHSIIETLVRLRDEEGLTLISVSHHPSTAVKADKIVVLDKGVIAEEGKYDELVSREGSIFKRMVDAGEEPLEE